MLVSQHLLKRAACKLHQLARKCCASRERERVSPPACQADVGETVCGTSCRRVSASIASQIVMGWLCLSPAKGPEACV